jgi:hypothetical protein
MSEKCGVGGVPIRISRMLRAGREITGCGAGEWVLARKE